MSTCRLQCFLVLFLLSDVYNKAGVLYWMDKIHNILYEIRKIELSTFDHSEIYLHSFYMFIILQYIYWQEKMIN